jgi:hypothetical protein
MNLFTIIDPDGTCFLDNVDVGGIIARDPEDLPYLAAILNAPVANFVWQLISKPFQNNYRSANKQFIAPLPIPDADEREKRVVSDLARRLQELHTRRRDWIDKFEKRLHCAQTVADPKTPDFLWADVGTAPSGKQSRSMPSDRSARDATAWAKAKMAEALDGRLAELDAWLKPGVPIIVENGDDEIRIRINGHFVIECFDLPDTPLVAAQWRHRTRDIHVTEAFDGKRLLKILLDLRRISDAHLAKSLLDADREIAIAGQEISETETEINQIIYDLYRLTAAERKIIEKGGISPP